MVYEQNKIYNRYVFYLIQILRFFFLLDDYIYNVCRPASLVGITKRETEVGKLSWHGNSMGFDRKLFFFFFSTEFKIGRTQEIQLFLFCITKKKKN